MFVISGHLQPYAWGRDGGLNPWLSSPTGGPQAELWFGAHPNGPSPLVGRPGTLADVAAPGDVPLLVKLLAAGRPLSIQIHPDAELAQQLWAAGSELVADDGEKVELLLALEPFSIFAGWRDEQQAAALLRATDPSLEPAAQAVEFDDVGAAVRFLLASSSAEVARLTPALLAALASEGIDDEQIHSFALAAESFPGDAGLLVLLLMDHHELTSHSAVYMPAGGVHAYAQGFGVEVMTASDNVLRLGLTPKPLAVEQALQAVNPNGDPHFIGGEIYTAHGRPTVTEYRPHHAPFAVDLVHDTEFASPQGQYRCVVAVRGQTLVRCGGDERELAQGQACAVLAEEDEIHIGTGGMAVVVEAREYRR
ncbi:MAG: mannose-6-phosphate isomerase, class I [Actinobacteria bacterium]|nr:mannose-6-phosphate isomerase, class I [Actinomycetota bacterium]